MPHDFPFFRPPVTSRHLTESLKLNGPAKDGRRFFYVSARDLKFCSHKVHYIHLKKNYTENQIIVKVMIHFV